MNRADVEKAAIERALEHSATEERSVILRALSGGWKPEPLEKVLLEWFDGSEYLDVVELCRDDIQPLLRGLVKRKVVNDVTGSARECLSFYISDAEQFLAELEKRRAGGRKRIPLDDHPDLVKMIEDMYNGGRVFDTYVHEISVEGPDVYIQLDVNIDGTNGISGTFQISPNEDEEPLAKKLQEIIKMGSRPCCKGNAERAH